MARIAVVLMRGVYCADSSRVARNKVETRTLDQHGICSTGMISHLCPGASSNLVLVATVSPVPYLVRWTGERRHSSYRLQKARAMHTLACEAAYQLFEFCHITGECHLSQLERSGQGILTITSRCRGRARQCQRPFICLKGIMKAVL